MCRAHNKSLKTDAFGAALTSRSPGASFASADCAFALFGVSIHNRAIGIITFLNNGRFCPP